MFTDLFRGIPGWDVSGEPQILPQGSDMGHLQDFQLGDMESGLRPAGEQGRTNAESQLDQLYSSDQHPDFGGLPPDTAVQFGQPFREGGAEPSSQAFGTSDWGLPFPTQYNEGFTAPADMLVPFDGYYQGGPMAGTEGGLSYSEAPEDNWKQWTPAEIAARAAQIKKSGEVSDIDPGDIDVLGYYGKQGIRPEGLPMTTVDTPYGPIKVSADAASDFQNFLQTLSDEGFPYGGHDAGSYNLRTKFGAGKGEVTASTPISSISEHGFGTAVDFNDATTLTNEQVNWIASHPDQFQDALQDNNIAWGHQINLKFGPDTPHMQWTGPGAATAYPAGTADYYNPYNIRPPADIPSVSSAGTIQYSRGQTALSSFGYSGPTGKSGLAMENPLQLNTPYTLNGSYFGGQVTRGEYNANTDYGISLPINWKAAGSQLGYFLITNADGTASAIVMNIDEGPNMVNTHSQNKGVDLTAPLKQYIWGGKDNTGTAAGVIHLQWIGPALSDATAASQQYNAPILAPQSR